MTIDAQKPLIPINLNPQMGTANVVGVWVAGKVHRLSFKNVCGAWSEDGEWQLVIKPPDEFDGGPWAHVSGEAFSIDAEDPSILRCEVDLLTVPIFNALNGNRVLPAYISLKDEVTRHIYLPPFPIQIWNTVFREGDIPPDSLDPPEGIEDGQGKIWFAADSKWIPADLVLVDKVEVASGWKLVVTENGAIQTVET